MWLLRDEEKIGRDSSSHPSPLTRDRVIYSTVVHIFTFYNVIFDYNDFLTTDPKSILRGPIIIKKTQRERANQNSTAHSVNM